MAKKQQFSPGRLCSNYVQVNYAVTTSEMLLIQIFHQENMYIVLHNLKLNVDVTEDC